MQARPRSGQGTRHLEEAGGPELRLRKELYPRRASKRRDCPVRGREEMG